MFLWRGSHVILVLVMVLICGMALTHPAWAYWYHVIFPPLFITHSSRIYAALEPVFSMGFA